MIYAYMRVSTPQQTLDNQHYALLKFADEHGLRIDMWITETSRGAKAYAERILGQLLPQLHAQDTLLVAEISRLGRRLIDIVQIFYLLMDKQVTVISVKEGLELGDTPNAKS
jgi:putative DNA-invertase from lambdoid prophage Rac